MIDPFDVPTNKQFCRNCGNCVQVDVHDPALGLVATRFECRANPPSPWTPPSGGLRHWPETNLDDWCAAWTLSGSLDQARPTRAITR